MDYDFPVDGKCHAMISQSLSFVCFPTVLSFLCLFLSMSFDAETETSFPSNPCQLLPPEMVTERMAAAGTLAAAGGSLGMRPGSVAVTVGKSRLEQSRYTRRPESLLWCALLLLLKVR